MNLLTKLNKKGSAFTWVYGLVFLAGGTIMYILFDQILKKNMQPIVENSATIGLTAEQLARNSKFLGFWGFVPFLLILVFLIYIIFWTSNKQREGIV